MSDNAILQRFERCADDTINLYFEVVADRDSGRIIFRETAEMVKGGRGCFPLLVIGAGLIEIVAIAEYLPALKWLLIPFSLAGSWGTYWYLNQKSIADDEKGVHVEIDTRTRKILLPVETYKPLNHTELDIDDVLAFYAWQENDSDSTQHSLRCTYGKNEEVVVLLENNRMNIDRCACLLGFLCDKEVWKRDKSQQIYRLKTDDLIL